MPSIISGQPGNRWLNDTDDLWWQLRVAGWNTCSFCWSYNGLIARYWPLPFHHHCRCRVVPVKPGHFAPHPFPDRRAEFLKLPASQQSSLLGKSLWLLIGAKVVGFDDVVLPHRLRSLAEVVHAKNLGIDQMAKAGVQPAVAAKAREADPLTIEEHEERHADELLDRLKSAVATHAAAVHHMATAFATPLAATVAGLTGAPGAILTPPLVAAGLLGIERATRERHAAELAALAGQPGAIGRARAWWAGLMMADEERKKKREPASTP